MRLVTVGGAGFGMIKQKGIVVIELNNVHFQGPYLSIITSTPRFSSLVLSSSHSTSVFALSKSSPRALVIANTFNFDAAFESSKKLASCLKICLSSIGALIESVTRGFTREDMAVRRVEIPAFVPE